MEAVSKIYCKLREDGVLWWFLMVISLANLVHIALVLDHPLTGQNSWRDAQTFGVARNFLEESGSWLEPKYDIRNEEDGRLPGEFPLQTQFCALFMKFTSVSVLNARISNFVLGLLSVAVLFLIVKKTQNQLAALMAVTLFLANPLAAAQMVSIMPETMVNLLALLTAFCYFYLRPVWLKWCMVTFFLSLCVLVKPSGFVLVVFLLVYDFLENKPKSSSWLWYVVVLTTPLFCLKLWMGYTLEFENPLYPYPITHHYVRGFSHFVADFGWEVVSSSLEKTFLHGFNVVSIFGLILFLVKPKALFGENQRAWYVGLILWLSGCVAFLWYAGDVQTVQLYYATPIIVPAILLLANTLSSATVWRVVVMLLLLLQCNIKVNTFNSNYMDSKEHWGDLRLEPVVDRFSSRKDLFIVYPFHFSDFTVLGQLGRRGFNLQTTEQLQSQKEHFEYLCLMDTTKRAEVLPYVQLPKLGTASGKEFYSIKK
jgi:4-amino-4-deoxy-L-arabinose transferase-like glycosyltransferase